MGYSRAGFDVVGVDINPQPRYPFRFIRGDALAYFATLGVDSDLELDVIHASPPCQIYSMTSRLHKTTEHPDLVGPTRELLVATGLPYVIENVPGAPLIHPVVLEGQMFEGLRTQRKRWFETNWPLDVPFLRSPRPAPNAKMGRKPKPGEWFQVVGNTADADGARKAMGIDWMTRDELSQAIPPAYTELIGHQLMQHVQQGAAA
ncbi:MAG: DNA cytosine methyltransferase [Chloroflexi bacterium]|nr:DNA cytosine methyltransferase [Chloroflexota bacterium]